MGDKVNDLPRLDKAQRDVVMLGIALLTHIYDVDTGSVTTVGVGLGSPSPVMRLPAESIGTPSPAGAHADVARAATRVMEQKERCSDIVFSSRGLSFRATVWVDVKQDRRSPEDASID